MSQPKAGETYDITLDPEQEGGVDRISLVKSPAIRRGFIALSEVVQEVTQLTITLAAKDEPKRVVTGPVLIPEQTILRLNKDGEPYHIRFSSDIIETINRKFMREKRLTATNQDHDAKTNSSDNYLFESWLIVDPDKDKSAALGLESLPAGTWMASYKIEDDVLWARIEAGEVLGFSLEGVFEYEEPTPTEAATPTPQPTTKMAKATPTRRRNRMHSAWKKIKGMKGFLSLVPGLSEYLTAVREYLSDHALEDGRQIRVDEDTLAVWVLDAEGNPTTETLPDGTYTLAGDDAGVVLEVLDGKSTKAIAEIEAGDSAPAAAPIEQTATPAANAELAAALERIAALEAKLTPPAETPQALAEEPDQVAQLKTELAAVKAEKEKLAQQPAVLPIEREAAPASTAPKTNSPEYFFELAKKLEEAAK